jgi:hypothetical protein
MNNSKSLIMKSLIIMVAALCLLSTGGVSAADPPQFVDVTSKAGISFTHTFGDSKMSNILEATGPGCALFDYNNDGYLDLYVVSGTYVDGVNDTIAGKSKVKPINRLYRSNGDGSFADVTSKAGVGDPSYSIGAVAADYDNDGDQDLFVTNYGHNVL